MANNPYYEEIHDHADMIWNNFNEELPVWSQFFHQERPLVLDLGCGAGNFLRDLSQKDPQYNYVGFELRYKRLVKGALKFKKKHIDNIRLVQARGEEIGRYFPKSSISKLYVNFPDPWAKKRQKKHRMLQAPFFDQLHQLLVPEGGFHFKTDHQEYFHTVHELLQQRSDFIVQEYTEDLHHSEYAEENILTEFEGLFKNQGLPAYYLLAKRVES